MFYFAQHESLPAGSGGAPASIKGFRPSPFGTMKMGIIHTFIASTQVKMPAFQSLVLSCFLVAGCAGSMAFHPRSTSLASQLAHAKISWSPQTQIHQPNTTDFFNATERWDVYAPPTYQAAISPATEADVAKAVSTCNQGSSRARWMPLDVIARPYMD